MIEDFIGDKRNKSKKRLDRSDDLQQAKAEPLLIYAILFSLIAFILTLGELII